VRKIISVDLGDRSYTVHVGPGEMARVGEAAAAVGDVTSVVVVSDSTVSELYGPAVLESLAAAGLEASLVDFPAGEEHKTLATVGEVFDKLFAVTPPVDRNSLIVALGGGVVGDLAGFVAATALRGLRWMHCPTTLLADVDASVGGKTGVDAPAGKNLIGAFHQPRGVLIDVDALATLPPEHVRNGLAECVKHAVIRDRTLLDFIEDHTEAILARDAETLTELIARNVAIKAEVVSADEREAGQRAQLNFGHTIGHAIEVRVGYGNLLHGEAVSLGMVAACHLAVERNLLEADAAGRVEYLLGRLELPTRRDGLNADAIWQTMQLDKKARGGQVRMILPVMLGEAAIFDDITPEPVRRAIDKLGQT